MSGNDSDNQGTMSTNNTSGETDKAVWDDKAVSDMFFSMAEARGGFTASEAQQVEQIMRNKGYTFTVKQLQGKYNKLRVKWGASKTAATASVTNGTTASSDAKTKAKGKTPARPRAKKEPAPDSNSQPKPKAAPKPRAKAAAKKEVDSDGNAIDAEGPPTKKRKASGGAMAGKKVIETVADVKEEGDEDSDSGRSAEAIKGDGAADAEGDTIVVEEYDAPEDERHEEHVQMVEATKVEIEEIAGQTVTETLQAEAQTVVQTSA